MRVGAIKAQDSLYLGTSLIFLVLKVNPSARWIINGSFPLSRVPQWPEQGVVAPAARLWRRGPGLQRQGRGGTDDGCCWLQLQRDLLAGPQETFGMRVTGIGTRAKAHKVTVGARHSGRVLRAV